MSVFANPHLTLSQPCTAGVTGTRLHCAGVVLALGLCAGSQVLAQAPSTSATQGDKSIAVTALPAIGAPKWEELNAAQQTALAPLKSQWNELGESHRRKWIAIVRNFASLSAEDQNKVQDRMASWATLNPAQRERARENFASSKLAAPSNKTGSWEEYLALPIEEREKLAQQASKKRPSAAKNPKQAPMASPVLFPSPQGGANTPWSQAQQLRGNLRDWIDPHTLLPLTPGR